MSWFDEQIKERKKHDNDDFADAMAGITNALTRRKSRVHTSDDRLKTKNAMIEILRYYHAKPREIPDDVTDPNDQLEFLCRPHGIMRRTVTLEKGWYRNAIGAMLGKKKDGTPVALIPDKIGRYTFYDESAGKRVSVNRKTQALLEEEATCFYKPFPLRKISIPSLLRYAVECIPVSSMIWIVVMMVLSTLIGMVSPKITHLIFSEVVTSQSMRLLISITVFSICVSISTLLLGAFRSLLMNRINTQLEISTQAATMARILSLPADFFKDYSAGELSAKAQYVNSIYSTIVSNFVMSGLTSLFSLAYISQIFIYTPMLVIPALCIIGVTMAFTVFNTLIGVRESREQMQISAKKSGMSYAVISGVQKIKVTGSEKRAFSRWVNLYAEEAKHTYGTPAIILLSGTISTAISLGGTIVMYFFAVQSGVSVADYYAFTAAYGMVSGAFLSAVGIAMNVARIRPTLEMAKPILQAVPEIDENKKVVTKLAGGIELNNVCFRYSESMPLVIDRLSLRIKPGQYIAIVGKTGCGKSTLVRLLLGFEKPQKGAIYYDGKDIAGLDLKSLRRKIGTVMQNGKLFQGDIFSNIVISAPWLTMDEAWEAAELAGIADDIRAMPMGMHTVIAEGSGGISGGQKQRLMIARAIAPKPKVLIFDEATSALDNLTQKKVSQSLDQLKCTRIVIAHRLSTIKQCDRIIVLDQGNIVEDGTYDELVAKNGFFAELVQRQRLDTD